VHQVFQKSENEIPVEAPERRAQEKRTKQRHAFPGKRIQQADRNIKGQKIAATGVRAAPAKDLRATPPEDHVHERAWYEGAKKIRITKHTKFGPIAATDPARACGSEIDLRRPGATGFCRLGVAYLRDSLSGSSEDAMSASTKSRIQKLPPVLVDRIAAGEVVEAPYSALKEMVENSLDAGAGRIRIETAAGGLDLLTVEDDGYGMHADDLRSAVERHATSKIRELEDLEAILSFGFRGEALASMASVSHLEIKSRREQDRTGALLEVRGGDVVREEAVVCKPGTVITVRDLFYATPARRNYVRSERAENGRNYAQIIRLALAHPQTHFVYVRDGKEYANLAPAQDLRERITQIYKSKIDQYLVPIEAEYEGLRMRGFVCDGQYHRANRDGQFTFINNRCVEIKHFSYLARKAYDELLPPGAHPYFFLFLEIDPRRVDVNVHPAKREVRLLDEHLLHGLVVNGIGRALRPNEPLSYGGHAGRMRSEPPRLQHGFLQIEQVLLNRPVQERRAHELWSPALEQAGSVGAQTERISADGEILDDQSGAGFRSSESAGNGAGGHATPPPGAAAAQRTDGVSVELGEDLAANAGDESGGTGTENKGFLPRRHFGLLFGTYILAEGDDGLYIIDQHTAHERINYEKKRNRLEAQRGQRQPLLHPITIDCLPDELASILERKDELLESGFVIEEFGPQAYIVREIPPYLEPGGEQDLIVHLIHRILEGESDVRLYDEYAAMKACKASIKRNDFVANEVLSGILRELSECENPSRCPHGRPTMLRISPEELDRLFYRA